MQRSQIIVFIFGLGMLTACAEPYSQSDRRNNVVTHNSWTNDSVTTGALLDKALDDQVGHLMDDNDYIAYDTASRKAMDSGDPKIWKNSRNGNHGTISPTGQYTNEDGDDCTDYTQVIFIKGHKYTGSGTACQQIGGSWRMINE